jgi:hypothetical protein
MAYTETVPDPLVTVLASLEGSVASSVAASVASLVATVVANSLAHSVPLTVPDPDTSDLTEEETAAAYSILSSEEISVIMWERLYEVANEDRVLVKLKEVVLRGFPQSSYDVDEELKQFRKFKHDLHVAEELVCYKDRIVVPVKLRPQVLETIHAANKGVSGMIGRVEETVF